MPLLIWLRSLALNPRSISSWLPAEPQFHRYLQGRQSGVELLSALALAITGGGGLADFQACAAPVAEQAQACLKEQGLGLPVPGQGAGLIEEGEGDEFRPAQQGFEPEQGQDAADGAARLAACSCIYRRKIVRPVPIYLRDDSAPVKEMAMVRSRMGMDEGIPGAGIL